MPQGGALLAGAGTISIPWGEIGGLGGPALLAQLAAAASAGALLLTPSTTATQDDDSGQVFYHGTATFLGGPLNAEAAAANSNKFGSAPGFYLATNPDTAVHFAAVAGQQSGNNPAVLQYFINNTALKGLQGAGAVWAQFLAVPITPWLSPANSCSCLLQPFQLLTDVYRPAELS